MVKFEDIPVGAKLLYTEFDSFFHPENWLWEKLQSGTYAPVKKVAAKPVDMWS